MALVSLDIHIDDLADVVAVYDRIQIHRSVTGINGTYVEITNPSVRTAAVLDGSVAGPFTLDTEILEITVDGGTAQQVTFSGTDPLDLATVIAQINAVIPGLASEVPTDTDQLRLTSPSTGSGSSIVITAGTAATALGLSTTKVNGKEVRIPISYPTADYEFRDLDGDETYYYKSRFSSTTTSVVSDFSDPQKGIVGTVVSATLLSVARVSLVKGNGDPVADRRITYIPINPQSVEGEYQVIPGLDARVSVSTNEEGVAEINLIRGVQYRMFIEGTSYGREFVVPNLDSFDVLALTGTAPDPFDIVTIPPSPIKVS